MRAVAGLQLDINNQAVAEVGTSLITVDELIAHYTLTELNDLNNKTQRTKEVYLHQLSNVVSPKWGTLRLRDVKPIAIEKWLAMLPGAPGTKAKTKGVMSVLFQHAMRYEWATSNPIRLVRQTAMPVHEQVVLTVLEIRDLLAELREPFRTLIFTAAITGLRRGELFGLKWQDLRFEAEEVNIVRSVVDQVEGPPKTLASRRPLPMCADLSAALQAWHEQTRFPAQTDWVFASPLAAGKRPYWPDAVLKRHVLPAVRHSYV